jgi:hypothetical protein
MDNCEIGNTSKKLQPTEHSIFYLTAGNHLFEECKFINFSYTKADVQGIIFNLDGLLSITFTDCKFDACSFSKADTYGGCIFCGSETNITIISCNFTNCKAYNGGGALSTDEGCSGSQDSKIIMRSSKFENCSVNGSNSRGGAIYCCLYDKRIFLIESCIFKNCTSNSTSGRGGAIYLKLCDTSTEPEYIFLFTGTIEFDDKCSSSSGNYIFAEYSTTNDYNRIININSYDYNVGENEAAIFMVNTSKSDSLESVIPFLKLEEGCNSITNLNECSEDCFWLYSETSGTSGTCKDKSDNKLECAQAKRSDQCTDNSINKFGSDNCIWISEETTTKCQEVKDSCNQITSQPTCLASGSTKSGECIWTNWEGGSCDTVKDSCNEIITKSTCLTLGAIKTDINELSCFWLFSNESDDDSDSGFCFSKNNESLICSQAKRQEQCINGDINKFGENCFWLLGSEDVKTSGRCKTKVCINNY